MTGVPALRGLIYAAIATFAIIFTWAALGTEVANLKNSASNFEVKQSVTLWKSCSQTKDFRGTGPKTCISTTDSDIDCASFKDHFRGAQAFYILAMLMFLVAIALGFVDHFKPGWLLKLPLQPKLQFLIVALITFFFALVAWAIAVSIPTTSFCGGNKFSDASGFHWGASPFLMLIAWICTVPMAIVAVVIPPRAPEESFSQAAKATHEPNTRTNTVNNAPV
jgi:hypothetical protein